MPNRQTVAINVADSIETIHAKLKELTEYMQQYEEAVEEEVDDLQNDKRKGWQDNCELESEIRSLEDQIEVMEGTYPTDPYGSSLEHEMKQEWWREAGRKYTLAQLEGVFGNRHALREYKDVPSTREVEELNGSIFALETLLEQAEDMINELRNC